MAETDAVEMRWADEDVRLLAARALWWPRRRTVCVADLHLGKAATFRSVGIPVPDTTTAHDLSRLTGLVRDLGAERLVILGDLIHAAAGRSPETLSHAARWRREHRSLDVLLIRGNHDARAGDPPADWGMRIADEPYGEAGDGRVMFAHYPEAAERAADGGAVLCGHLHPAVRLRGAVSSVRAACFWMRAGVGVLPAFGSFTGTLVVTPAAGDRVFVVCDGEIVEAGARPGVAVRGRCGETRVG